MNIEQLSIFLRYAFDHCVKEVFVEFVPVERITGQVLADAIISHLTAWSLSLADLRGQWYGGSSNMAGARSGCKSIVQLQAPMAIYSHCAAHQLNLAVASAWNIESTLGEIARFFKFSPKWQHFLDRAIDQVIPWTKKKLKNAGHIRWIGRIDSYAIHTVMQAMSCPSQFRELGTNWNWDGETLMKADGFFYQLECSTFLVCFKILLEVLSYLRSLTL